MKEIIKTIEEMKEVDYCMYCGSKLDKIEHKDEKICPNNCVRMKFVKLGETIEYLNKKVKVDKATYNDIQLCKPPMIS